MAGSLSRGNIWKLEKRPAPGFSGLWVGARGAEAGLLRNPQLRVPGSLWGVSWGEYHVLQGDCKFTFSGARGKAGATSVTNVLIQGFPKTPAPVPSAGECWSLGGLFLS